MLAASEGREGSMKFINLESGRRDEMIDISHEIQRHIVASGFKDGAVLVFCPHTTAGLTINEGTDPAVRADLIDCLSGLVPWDKIYGHAEGNSPAHVKASLMGASLLVPVEDGQLVLGQWQRIFFCEFDGPRPRGVYVKFLAS